jgi:hypothetical protein
MRPLDLARGFLAGPPPESAARSPGPGICRLSAAGYSPRVTEDPADIEATALVPARPEEVFDFLADLDNHWLLAAHAVRVVSLDGATGGFVQIRGPLGIHRTARTRVTAERSPRLLIGVAELGESTRARVSWTLAGRLDQTRVRLAAHVEHATPLDRALLSLGGRAYLRRAFATTLDRLAERFS